MIYMERWIKLECPDCDSFNWFQFEEDDQDITSVKCYNCKSIISLLDDEWADQTYTVKGKRRPK